MSRRRRLELRIRRLVASGAGDAVAMKSRELGRRGPDLDHDQILPLEMVGALSARAV
jgi:hypothetical protein